MAQSRIAIIGTGLIGTSIGLCLMSQKDRKFEIVGTDRDRGNARAAKKLGALDREVGSLEEAVSDAGLVIIAVPVGGVRQIFESIAPLLVTGAIVTDVCSTKAEILKWAAELLPPTVHFIGGHPMAGREKSGPGAAAADLFKGATWAVTPSPHAEEQAVNVVLGMIETAGANPVYIDAAEHDQYAAAVSHVPILLSVALFRMVRDSVGWEDAALLAGPGFRDLTRLASGDPAMSAGIVETNREAIAHWLKRYRETLDVVEKALNAGEDVTAALFTTTAMDRDAFLLNPPFRRQPDTTDPGSSADSIGRMLMGSGYDKMKDIINRPAKVGTDDAKLRRQLGSPGSRDDR
jgi:prephenate dehydrogenase